jgi:uncharacterized SAM-binding protein YcdF (DUF218 family)
MFYFLSKAIIFLIMPFSIFFILCLFSLFTKNKKRKKSVLILSFVWLFLISNTWIVSKAFKWWEWPFTNISAVGKTYDVGIVLSGGLMSAMPAGADHASMGPNGDRFTQAFLLYKAGKIKKIFITGISHPQQMAIKMGETRQAAYLLVKWGVKQEDILFEEQARNTRENALNSKQVLNSRFPNASFLLITSASHMRRSKKCFDKVGMQTEVFPADFNGREYSLTFENFFIPDTQAMSDFDSLWHEWIGYATYKLMGYC